jgi:hypothetical protein
LHCSRLYQHNLETLEIDPEDPGSLYTGSDSGLFHSSDSGLSWTESYTLGQVFARFFLAALCWRKFRIAEFGCSGTGAGIAYSWDGGTRAINFSRLLARAIAIKPRRSNDGVCGWNLLIMTNAPCCRSVNGV